MFLNYITRRYSKRQYLPVRLDEYTKFSNVRSIKIRNLQPIGIKRKL